MTSVSITKKPTKRDYIVELAKKCKISSTGSNVSLLIKILNKTLKDENQLDTALRSIYDGELLRGSSWLQKEDIDNIQSTFSQAKLHLENKKTHEKYKFHNVLLGCECSYCICRIIPNEEEEEEECMEVSEILFNDKLAFLNANGIIYDPDTQEEIGKIIIKK